MFKVHTYIHTYSAYLPEQHSDELPLCQQRMQLDLQGPGAEAGEVCGAQNLTYGLD